MKTRKIENVDIGELISEIKGSIAIMILNSRADFPKEGMTLKFGQIDLDSVYLEPFNHGFQDIIKWVNGIGYGVVLINAEHKVREISGSYNYPIKTFVENPELSIKIFEL